MSIRDNDPDGGRAPIDPPDVSPAIHSVTPNTGTSNGGTRVVINGRNFRPGTKVLFGRLPFLLIPSQITFRDRNTLECTTPGHSLPAGFVPVQVITPSGEKDELELGFRYVAAPAPQITSVSPLRGPRQGGTVVRIRGKHFAPGCRVHFGGKQTAPTTFVHPTLVRFVTLAEGTPYVEGPTQPIVLCNPDHQCVDFENFVFDDA